LILRKQFRRLAQTLIDLDQLKMYFMSIL